MSSQQRFKKKIPISDKNNREFYAGARFENSPLASNLPIPPLSWLNELPDDALIWGFF